MRESIFETLIGAIVIGVAGFFLWFALARGGDAGSISANQYEVTARFNSVSGISRGSDVRIAGVKAGVVKSIDGDPETFEAVLKLALDSKWALPDDTDARISTDGLLGGAYIALEPGAGFENIAQDGTGEIQYTRGSVDLLTLFASFASGSGGGSDESSSASSAADDDFGLMDEPETEPEVEAPVDEVVE